MSKTHPNWRPQYANRANLWQAPEYDDSPIVPDHERHQVWSNASDFLPPIGEDGWIGPEALRHFTEQEFRYARVRYFRGDRTLPPVDPHFIYFRRVLVMAKPKYDDLDAILATVGATWHDTMQLWICEMAQGGHAIMTPADFNMMYMPWVHRTGYGEHP